MMAEISHNHCQALIYWFKWGAELFSCTWQSSGTCFCSPPCRRQAAFAFGRGHTALVGVVKVLCVPQGVSATKTLLLNCKNRQRASKEKVTSEICTSVTMNIISLSCVCVWSSWTGFSTFSQESMVIPHTYYNSCSPCATKTISKNLISQLMRLISR